MADLTKYSVWSAHHSENDACKYEARDERSAAVQAAAHDHAHCDGWEWTWPVTYHVRVSRIGGVAIDGAQTFAVEVERHMYPEFDVGRAKPLALER